MWASYFFKFVISVMTHLWWLSLLSFILVVCIYMSYCQLLPSVVNYARVCFHLLELLLCNYILWPSCIAALGTCGNDLQGHGLSPAKVFLPSLHQLQHQVLTQKNILG